ncbi:MAG TPA: ABC transporter ATP-binding protein, partial [Bacilli bacterium]|nr:ABC transporter ATP-binding protein [Bacilli bacterium]
LGENGAGKSTLMSILFGLYQPDQGEIYKNGQLVSIKNPNDANDLGIGMVHQHFKLVENFTVLDNIIMGAEPLKRGLIDRVEARKRVLEISQRYKLFVNPDALIEDISVGMQQRVEILKMLYRENEILIFDEPTAVLTPQEIDELMGIMKGLVAEGKSILFISHKLNEIMKIADRCTVLRRGKNMGVVKTKNTTIAKLSKMMVGRDIEFVVNKEPAKPQETVLKVENLHVISPLSKKHVVNDVSFTVRKGEIVCLAGIEGNGQSDLIYALTGLMPIHSGSIYLNNIDISKKNIRFRNDNGLSHIPEDRHKYGLVLDYSLAYNLVLKKYHTSAFQKQGFLKPKAINDNAEVLINKYDIRSGQGPATIARSMSGGNQQKAIIAREVDKDSDLLVAVQVTRGLDVGAIEFIHQKILEERNRGKAILMMSLELEEVMSLSDRILVMFEGQIVAELDPRTTSDQELGLFMTSGKSGGIHGK